MTQTIISTIFSVLLGILGIAFLVCIAALAIIYLSRRSAFFMKLYMFFFQREDYDVYREVKQMIKRGEALIKYAAWTPMEERKGISLIVSDKYVSIWKDSDCYLVSGFHDNVLKEIIKEAHLEEDVVILREQAIEYVKELNRKREEGEARIKQLEKEIEEGKAKLAKLNEQDNA